VRGRDFLETTFEQFRKQKRLADRAVAHTSDNQFFAQRDPESNRIASIVKHVAGSGLRISVEKVSPDRFVQDGHRVFRRLQRLRSRKAAATSSDSWTPTSLIVSKRRRFWSLNSKHS
jgi:Protein of unknown function (DUF1572)